MIDNNESVSSVINDLLVSLNNNLITCLNIKIAVILIKYIEITAFNFDKLRKYILH